MENLVRVTSHLAWRQRMPADDAPLRGNDGDLGWFPGLVPTTSGKPFIMTAEGDVWRAFVYRQGQILRTPQPLTTLASAGAMYGRFTAETADLGGPPLIESAPGFHDLDQVYIQLVDDLDHAGPERSTPIDSLRNQLDHLYVTIVERCRADGLDQVPQRVVHNDTKLTNVLFDRDHGRATAVLDLDLVMMGPSWHDVGDLVRSAAWTAPGSETGPVFSIELFDAVVGAFAERAGHSLTEADLGSYALAGPRLSFELGLRYLNDHLRAEPHLAVDGVDAHLHRGIANVKLAEEMLTAYDALRPIVDGFVAER